MKSYLPLTLLCFVFSTFTLYADNKEEAYTDTIADQSIAEITVTGLALQKLSFPYQVVEKEKMELSMAQSPAEVLHRFSGVSLARDGAWATSINVRGFSEQKLMFLSDGDRMLTATDIAGVLSTVDMSGLEKIELIKGAGSVLYGSGAMGGIVNLVPYRPEYTDRLQVNGLISGGYQTVNQLFQTNGTVNFTNKDWYLSAKGSFRTSGDYQTPEGKISNSQFNDASWSVLGGKQLNDQQELLFNYSRHKAWDAGLPGGSAFPDGSLVRYMGFARNQLNGEYIFKELTDVVRELKVKAYMQQISREVENKVNAKTSIYPSSNNITTGAKATADLYFNDYQTMTVGAEGWMRETRTTRIKIAAPVADTTFTGEQPTPDAEMMDVGVFGHYQLKIDPKYWILHLGARADYVQTHNEDALKEVFKYKISNGVKTELTPDNKVLFNEGNHTDITYALHADLNYLPTKNQKIILSFANAYRVASLEERFKYIDQSGKLMVGNPDLKPELGWFSNLSYHFGNEKINLDFDLFANYLQNMIAEKQGTFTYGNGTAVSAWINTNINQAWFVGSELDFSWLITEKLKFGAIASFVQAKDMETNEHLPLIPPFHGNTSLEYEINHWLSAEAEMNWEYATMIEEGETEASKFAVLSAKLNTSRFKVGQSEFRIMAGVNNIFNTAYTEYLSTLRGVNRLEPGRNFTVKAFYYF